MFPCVLAVPIGLVSTPRQSNALPTRAFFALLAVTTLTTASDRSCALWRTCDEFVNGEGQRQNWTHAAKRSNFPKVALQWFKVNGWPRWRNDLPFPCDLSPHYVNPKTQMTTGTVGWVLPVSRRFHPSSSLATSLSTASR
jgi:hypothetical protein